MRLLQSNFSQSITGIGFADRGRLLVAGGTAGFETWDLAAGTSAHFAVGDTNHIFAFVVDPLGRRLYFSGSGLGCRILPLDRAEFHRLPGHEHHVIDLATSSDGSLVAVSRGGMWQNRMECWAVLANNQFSQAWSVPLGKEGVSFQAITFHPDGTRLTSAEDRDTTSRFSHWHVLAVRDTATGALLDEFGSVPDTLYLQMTTTAKGELIFWNKGELGLWSIADRKRVHKLMHPRRTNVQGLAVHPSGQFFVTVANDGQARFWDVPTFKVTQALNWKVGKLLSIAVSADGMLAAAGGENGQVVLWDLDL